ncbi:hypothetical protein LN042_21290 [Kitasatospora sp. RB6PN24]|uniref:hypothetical protein n=1 Tax=Kitasatospora humi TaxID=2893891 RepID=UPI001E2943D6|nr:hypothetical protein [Kitasatospora humi]MCC9309578.1 hypothetical protein [Kitasatospora humi]
MADHSDADDQVLDDLFRLVPGEFVPARDRAVRAARAEGRREEAAALAALRRPTQAAWAVNQLARNHTPDLAKLLETGARMRAAQARPDPEALRELLGQRRRLLAELVDAAVRDAAGAGERLGDAAMQAVEQTLAAAMADPDAAGRVAAGRLVAALSVPTALPDLGPLLAAVPDPPTPSRAGGRQRTTTASRTRRQPEHDTAENHRRLVAELEQRRDRLRGQAQAAQRASVKGERDLAGAQEQAERAQGRVEEAQAAVERARFAARRADEARQEAADRLEELRGRAAELQAAAERADEELQARRREQP